MHTKANATQVPEKPGKPSIKQVDPYTPESRREREDQIMSILTGKPTKAETSSEEATK